jgi:hypothetical protein
VASTYYGLRSVVTTMARYHEYATDYEPMLVIRVVAAKLVGGFWRLYSVAYSSYSREENK